MTASFWNHLANHEPMMAPDAGLAGDGRYSFFTYACVFEDFFSTSLTMQPSTGTAHALHLSPLTPCLVRQVWHRPEWVSSTACQWL